MKVCFICKYPKPASDFYAHADMSDGRIGKCKKCCVRGNRAYNCRKHRIIQKEFNWLFKTHQKRRCALCNQEFPVPFTRGRAPNIDHAHDCDKHGFRYGCAFCIRGILCNVCNRFRIPGIEFLAEHGSFTHPYLLKRPILMFRSKHSED